MKRGDTEVKMSNISESDFWWTEEQHRSLYVGVGHHKPLTDDDDPCGIKWFHSLENGCLSEVEKRYPLPFIHQWRNACNNTNVYRTLRLFDDKGQSVVLGPFLIDIDNSQSVKNGYKEDLEDALKVVRATIELLRGKPYAIQDNYLRLFFTGRKGFNIEVRPSALRISMCDTADAQIKSSSTKLDEIIKTLRRRNNIDTNATTAVSDGGTVIDRIYGDRFGYRLKHPYIRLHSSINEWISKRGSKMARRKIRLSPDELFSSSAKQICQKAAEGVSTPYSGEP